MIRLYLLSLLVWSDAASVLFKENPLFVKSCDIGKTVENECNKCVCSENHVYECSPKTSTVCLITTQNDSPSSCLPNTIYVLNETICICNRNGHWPHKQCNQVFKSFVSPGTKCKPNSYVVKDCNICRCGPDGKIDESHCTKNKCKTPKSFINFSQSRRLAKQNNVYGNCEVKNWYSLAPCQFCFCVNENKLVCNTGNSYSHKLELGAYNLSVCGKDLIREAIELIPENERSLRYGIDKEKRIDEETTPVTTTTTEIIQERDLAVNVNHDTKELSVTTNNNPNDDYEYYTDSEEKKPPKVIGREGASTQLPYEEESSNDLVDERQDAEQELTDNEMGVEIEAKINVNQTPKPVDTAGKETEQRILVSKHQQPASIRKENFNLGEALKLNLPMVLDKVFQMALRKSMMSVDSDSECTPGAVTILKCNVCFCMKDNKLLCTNNVCE